MFSRDGTDSNEPLGSCMSASVAGPLHGLLVDPCSVRCDGRGRPNGWSPL